MDLLGMMRRAAGAPTAPGPSVDASKPSIRKALQNRGGVMRRQENGASNTGGYPLPQVGKESDLVVGKHDAKRTDDSESKAEHVKVVTQLSSHVQSHTDSAKQPNQIFETVMQVSRRLYSHAEIAEEDEGSASEAQLPVFVEWKPLAPGQISVTAVQPDSVTILPCAWRSSSSSSKSQHEDEHAQALEGDHGCEAEDVREANSETLVERFKAVAQLSNHIHSHATIAKQHIVRAVTQVSKRKCSHEEIRKKEEDAASDGHLPGSVVNSSSDSESEHESEDESEHEHEHENGHSDCDADSEGEDNSETKMERLKAVTKETAAAAAQHFGRLSGLLAENGKIPTKGIERLSDFIAVNSKGLLPKSEKLIVEPSTSQSVPKSDSSMLSAIRNRGGVMPTHDGFEAFYGIENPEPNVISSVKDCIGARQDSLDSPRDGFESFYGYDDTPPKTVMPPRLRLGSLEGLKDAFHENGLSPDSEVPNFSIDTFRRVY